MRKKLSILLLLLFGFVMLVSCGNRVENSSMTGSSDYDDKNEENMETVTSEKDSYVGKSRPIASYEDIKTSSELKIPEGKTVKIGFISQTETIQFNVYLSNAMRSELEKYGSQVEFQLFDARAIAANQVSLAEDLITSGVDVAVLSCIDYEASAPAVQKIVDADIPVISVNTVVANHDLATAYIGVDDSEAGKLAVQLMSEKLDDEGNINIIKGLLGDPANEKRLDGVKSEIVNTNLNIASSQAADWDRGKAMTITEDWITSGDDFDGIISMNDEMAISAINVLKASNIDIPIIGIDAIKEALDMVKSGDMYATLFQNPFKQGAGAANLAIAAALGEDVSYDYVISFEVVTSENVDDIYKLYDSNE